MADTMFDEAISAIADGAWGVIQVGLFLKNAWTPDQAGDTVIADATSAGATELAITGYARLQNLLGSITYDPTTPREVYDADSFDFGTPDPGGDYDTLIIASQGTDDSDARLILAIDLGAQTTDGSPLSFDPDPDGILELGR